MLGGPALECYENCACIKPRVQARMFILPDGWKRKSARKAGQFLPFFSVVGKQMVFAQVAHSKEERRRYLWVWRAAFGLCARNSRVAFPEGWLTLPHLGLRLRVTSAYGRGCNGGGHGTAPAKSFPHAMAPASTFPLPAP